MKMNRPWSTISSISALLLGVILFWIFGNDWLNLESASIFVMGLLGVTVSVLGFSLWNIRNHSSHKEN
jgi:drug/metabolite transporter (DMT)-like permease